MAPPSTVLPKPETWESWSVCSSLLLFTPINHKILFLWLTPYHPQIYPLFPELLPDYLPLHQSFLPPIHAPPTTSEIFLQLVSGSSLLWDNTQTFRHGIQSHLKLNSYQISKIYILPFLFLSSPPCSDATIHTSNITLAQWYARHKYWINISESHSQRSMFFMVMQDPHVSR